MIKTVCFLIAAGIAVATPITGQLGSNTVATFYPPDTDTYFSISNGTYTLSVYSLAPLFGGCIPPFIDGSSTGVRYGPCTYQPGGTLNGFNLSFGFGWRVVQGGNVIAQAVAGNLGPSTLLFNFTYSGASIVLQPQTQSTAFAPLSQTSSANVPISIGGFVELRTNGSCVWCESFTGSGVSAGVNGTPRGGGLFGSFSATFTGETVPEPSTWVMALVGMGLLAWFRRQRP